MSNPNYPYPPQHPPLEAIVQTEPKRSKLRLILWLVGGSLLLILVVCVSIGLWFYSEVKNERRRRDLIEQRHVVRSDGEQAGFECDVIPWPGLEAIPLGRRIGSWMMGKSPMSPMRLIQVHRECDQKIADEFLTLFPETNTVLLECKELDPKLADRIAKVGRQQFFTMVIRQQPGDNVDALLKVCADHHVPLDYLESGFTGATAEGMANAAKIPTLASIEIAGATDAMWSGFQKHQRLQTVRIWNSPGCTDTTAQVLATCPQLKEVYLDGTKIGDSGLSSIGLIPQLTNFRWSHAPISVAALRLINPPSIPKIESAILIDAGITNEHLNEIGKWPKLSHLNISQAKVDADGLGSLQRLPLASLILRDCPIDDAAVAKLLPLAANIQTLDLSGTKITRESGWITIAARRLKKLHLDRTAFSADLLEAVGQRTYLDLLEIGGPTVDATWLPKLDGLLSGSGELHLTGASINDATLAPPGCKSRELVLNQTSVTVKCLENLGKWKDLKEVMIIHPKGSPPPFTYAEGRALAKELGVTIYFPDKPLEFAEAALDHLRLRFREAGDE